MNPAAARTRRTSSANSGELCRVSRAMTHDRGASGPLARRDVIGQAPGALGDRPVVQDVGADRVHLAPPAAGAELEDGVEGVVEHLPAARPRCPRRAGPDSERTGGSVSQRRMLAAAEAESSPAASAWADPGECVFGCGHPEDPPHRRPRQPAMGPDSRSGLAVVGLRHPGTKANPIRRPEQAAGPVAAASEHRASGLERAAVRSS